MNPTPKPKKPKSVARTQKKPKKSMKKGGGRKEIPKTHRQPNIKWSTKYREERPKQPTVSDVLYAHASYNAERAYDYICEKGNNAREACI